MTTFGASFGAPAEVATGKGHHWTAAMRQALVYHVTVLDSSVNDIVTNMFLGASPSIRYLRQKIGDIKVMHEAGDDVAMSTYVMGPLQRGGNAKQLTSAQEQELVRLRRYQNGLRLGPFTKIFNESEFDYPALQGVSKWTVGRILKHHLITRKEKTQIPIGVNYHDQLQWMDSIRHVDILFLIDVDENKLSRDKLVNKWAWELRGEEAQGLQQDIVICGYSFSVISAYTPLGFLCWSIYDGTITSLEVEDFFREELDRFINEDSFVILDNASNHSTICVRRTFYFI